MVLPVSAASSQQPNSSPPISKINGENTLAVQVRVVAITALAYDTWGRLVGGLSKDGAKSLCAKLEASGGKCFVAK